MSTKVPTNDNCGYWHSTVQQADTRSTGFTSDGVEGQYLCDSPAGHGGGGDDIAGPEW